jgi:trans-aconitate methyltransferase
MSRSSLQTKSAKWNPADYAANSVVQQTWARELIARLKLRGEERILDVGCGDGKVTAEIAQAVPRGFVLGIDASAEMIGFARKVFPTSQISNLTFQICDARKIEAPKLFQHSVPERRSPTRRISAGVQASACLGDTLKRELQRAGSETGAPFDIIFSNAALHWVDDHQAILRGMAAVLKPGGRLIVSCGGKGNAQDVFVALRPEMRLKRWREFFRGMPTPYFFHAPGDYEKWLAKFGFKINALKLAPKDATYAGADGFAAWLRTTWLPYVQRVPENVAQASCLCVSGAKEQLTGKMPVPLPSPRKEFIASVTQRYVTKHPPDADGNVHVRMVRLEIDAVKI